VSLARNLALRYDGVMSVLPPGLHSWERTIRAVELVKNRLLRATVAMDPAGIAYAVIGGNAVAAWVERVDQSAVRFKKDVDLFILRSDLDATKAALEAAASSIGTSPASTCSSTVPTRKPGTRSTSSSLVNECARIMPCRPRI
jgi:hypothetical protein